MPKPKQKVLDFLAGELRLAADKVQGAKNSDNLLKPSLMVAQVNHELLQTRESWRASNQRGFTGLEVLGALWLLSFAINIGIMLTTGAVKECRWVSAPQQHRLDLAAIPEREVFLR